MGTGQKEVLFNDTQGVEQGDLNNAQRFLRAVMADWIVAQAGSFQGAGDPGAAGYDRTAAVFSYGDSAAPFPSATALRIDTLAGPLIQWRSGPTFPLSSTSLAANWGTDPYAMIYWCSANELQTTHAVGDATHPRWDLVCVKLSDVNNDVADTETRLMRQVVSGDFVTSSDDFIMRRKVTLTKQVVQGTPTASPTMPSVPSGYLPYYAVLVPATYNAAFSVDDGFHDYRMPLGSFAVDLYARDAVSPFFGFGGGFTATGDGPLDPIVIGNSQTLDFIPRIPIAPHSCRLIGVSAMSSVIANTTTITLGRYNAIGGGLYSAMGGNSTWTLSSLNATSGVNDNYVTWTQRLANQAGNSPPSVASKPPWGTGRPSGYASRHESSLTANIANLLGIRYVTNGSGSVRIIKVRFYFAGMPS